MSPQMSFDKILNQNVISCLKLWVEEVVIIFTNAIKAFTSEHTISCGRRKSTATSVKKKVDHEAVMASN